ncbi:hypothetical protein VU01_10942 [Candidatus Electrothrix marina]|uniref:DUF262 domain-containing protein n=1 Tax=Candidatus Electrothrix marina TaxID=1859130 RepID=A0A444JF97_9BACT|nr:hypothetical protein VU01_10942 [Candidatus Electrothrix marina]
MNFNTANNTFRQLMGNGLLYRVPPFQRDYSWSADEWDDLWQDFLSLHTTEEEPIHYMGYLVLQSSDSKRFDIIDGQQRITTISIILLAAISLLHDLAQAESINDKRAEQLRNSYIGYLDPVTLTAKSKLTLNRHNDRFYQDYLVPLQHLPQRGLNASEHLLRKAFLWFKARLKADLEASGEAIAGFVDQTVDRLFFTVITVTDELNAFKVFETLNARGVRLSATDLLKNYLFSVISKEGAHVTELKTLEERWEAIIGLLGSDSFPEFLRVFWNSGHKLVRKTHLFKTIRQAVSDRGQAFALIRDLDRHARIYGALRNPLDTSWERDERNSLQQLQMFNVRQPLSLLLAAFDHFGDTDRNSFKQILRAVTMLSFRYNVICGLPGNELERVYNAIAVQLADGTFTSARAVITALQPIYPEDKVFKIAFADKSLRTTSSRNKKVVRYILFELERCCSNISYDPDNSAYTIEHILPEHPEQGWDTFDDRQHENAVYQLGNMTLLSASANRELGNAPYQEKKTVYAQSEFAITQGISRRYDDWTPAAIASRQIWMASQAVSIWNIPL